MSTAPKTGKCKDCGKAILKYSTRCMGCNTRRYQKGKWVECAREGCTITLYAVPSTVIPSTGVCCSHKCSTEHRRKSQLVRCFLCGTETAIKPAALADHRRRGQQVTCGASCRNSYALMQQLIKRHGVEGLEEAWKRLLNRYLAEKQEEGNYVPVATHSALLGFAKFLAAVNSQGVRIPL